MNRIILSVSLMLLFSGFVAAQEYPRAELFGGYSFQRLGLSDTDINAITSQLEGLINDLGYTATFTSSKSLKKGFTGSLTLNANRFFGIVADVRYHFNNIITGDIPDLDETIAIKYEDLTFLAGPRFSLRKNERITPFVHALVGLDRWTVSGDVSAGDRNIGTGASESNNGLGVALGGGFDLNLSDAVSFRVIQTDYYLSRHENRTMNNLVISSGIVFRFSWEY